MAMRPAWCTRGVADPGNSPEVLPVSSRLAQPRTVTPGPACTDIRSNGSISNEMGVLKAQARQLIGRGTCRRDIHHYRKRDSHPRLPSWGPPAPGVVSGVGNVEYQSQ